MTVESYLAGEETTRRRELAFGVLREPPAPTFVHQVIVGRVFRRLDAHVRRYGLGRVVVSPIDVILDRDRSLIVQPDVVFVSGARLDICTDRIWGAPDLAVEVLSTAGRRHDRTVKTAWYRRYGVRECWIVDPVAKEVEVLQFGGPDASTRVFREGDCIHSGVLPRLRFRARDVVETDEHLLHG